MPRKTQVLLKKKRVKKALLKCKGQIASAATRLGCHVDTLYKFIRRHPKVKAYRDSLKEGVIDFVEDKLMVAVGKGDLAAIKFYLQCQGKHRDWVVRKEHQVEGDLQQTITVEGIREAMNELRTLGSTAAIAIAEGPSDTGQFRGNGKPVLENGKPSKNGKQRVS